MHMSRLSALKEYAFMKVLRENGFLVPMPIAQSRHTVVMELIDAFPLRQIQSVPDPAGLYGELIDVILQLASFGLIHGDFNEFNILVREDQVAKDSITKEQGPEEDGLPVKRQAKESDATPTNDSGTLPTEASPFIKLTPIIIDFPQMISIDHTNAEMYFDRDVNCIRRFFERRFNFVSDERGPSFPDAKKLTGGAIRKRLDVEVEASGFSKKMAKELEKYMQVVGVDGDQGQNEDDLDEENDFNASSHSSEAEEMPENCPRDLSPDTLGKSCNDGGNINTSKLAPNSMSFMSITADQQDYE